MAIRVTAVAVSYVQTWEHALLHSGMVLVTIDFFFMISMGVGLLLIPA
jgi:hypothetical protein